MPFDSSRVTEILSFSEENPWKPKWPKELIERFLTQFISSNNLVFDVFLDRKRIGTAVLLDLVKNPGRLANLEILGLHPKSSEKDLIRFILENAKRCVPSSHRGLQIGFQHEMTSMPSVVEENELQLYYETYSMLNRNPKTSSAKRPNIEVATDADENELYQVLTESFQFNNEASIPEFRDWQKTRRNSTHQKTWVFRRPSILGFLNLSYHPRNSGAEIRTVGVLPKARSQGIGRALIETALSDLESKGIPSCDLSVAVQNYGALDLYKSLGFEITDRYVIYQWIQPSHRGIAVEVIDSF